MLRARSMPVLLTFALFAGCVATEDESGPPPACVSTYVSVHYSNAPEAGALRSAFEDAGYEWEGRSERIANATSPDGTRVVLSTVPGLSGGDLILSVEDPTGSPTEVRSTAREASAIVNASGNDTEMTQWIEDTHTATC